MIDMIGWTLVHAGWQGGMIAAVVAVALWLTRAAGASTRYVIALIGLGLTVAAPIATTAATFAGGWPLSERAIRAAIHPVHGTPAAAPGIARVNEKGDASSETGIARSSDTSPQSLARRIDGALPWIVTVWLVGIALLSLRVLSGAAIVRRLGRRGVSLADAQIRALADDLATRLGIRSAVRVLQSAQVDVPMVIGWLRPAVLVPVSLLAGVAPAELEMLLAHELAHIRRYDNLVNLAQTIIETLLFFHPAVWWISARVREERENCCDDLAIALSHSDRRAYGAMLLRLEESRDTPALASAATDGSLLRRVRRIVVGPPSRVELGATWFAGVVTLLTVLFVAVPNRTPAVASPVPPSIARRSPARSLPMPEVHNPSRSTPMLRPSLLAGAAAITVAAVNLSAQVPNVSGRWLALPDSVTQALVQENSAFDSLTTQPFTIDQTDRTLTITRVSSSDFATITFQIDASDGVGLHVKGPISASVRFNSIDVTLDADLLTPSIRALWTGQGKTAAISAALPADITRILAMMTLSLDAAGNLLMQVDVPATDTQPAKHTVQHFRRA